MTTILNLQENITQLKKITPLAIFTPPLKIASTHLCSPELSRSWQLEAVKLALWQSVAAVLWQLVAVKLFTTILSGFFRKE